MRHGEVSSLTVRSSRKGLLIDLLQLGIAFLSDATTSSSQRRTGKAAAAYYYEEKEQEITTLKNSLVRFA